MQVTQRDAERFWAKVDKTPGRGPNGDCWLWAASDRGGYGSFHLNDRRIDAHRVAFHLAGGDQKPGLVVMHTCDTKGCCNPAHLRLGTASENMRDAYAKGLVRPPTRMVPMTDAELFQLKDEYDHGLSKRVLCKKWQLAPTTLNRMLNRAPMAIEANERVGQASGAQCPGRRTGSVS